MRTIKFGSVVFGVTSKLPVMNKIHWCMVLRRPSPAINKRRLLLLPPMSATNLPRSGDTLFTTPDARTVDNTRWSNTLVKNSDFTYFTCTRHPVGREFSSEYCHRVLCGKSRMVWLTGSERSSRIRLFILTEYTNVTHRRTDTAWRHRPRLCKASRG